MFMSKVVHQLIIGLSIQRFIRLTVVLVYLPQVPEVSAIEYVLAQLVVVALDGESAARPALYRRVYKLSFSTHRHHCVAKPYCAIP